MFRVILRTNSDYFPKQHLPAGICNGAALLFFFDARTEFLTLFRRLSAKKGLIPVSHLIPIFQLTTEPYLALGIYRVQSLHEISVTVFVTKYLEQEGLVTTGLTFKLSA
jgi:hypothetical protein